MKQWYTAGELADLNLPSVPSTKRGVNLAADREDWRNRLAADGSPLARHRKGRGGGWEYHVSLLPEAARAALAARAITVGGDTSAQAARERGLARAAGLDSRPQRRAEARAALVQACRQYIREGGLPVERGLFLFVEAYNAGELPVEDWITAAVPRTSRGSLRNWAKQLEGGGLARLAGNYGNRRGSGKIDADPAMRDLVEGMLQAYPHASSAHVMDALRARFPDAELPTLRSVQRYLQGWRAENAQVFAAVANPDAWRSRFLAAPGSAAEHVVRLNQVWELDSTIADLMLSDGRRHAIIAAIDVHSRRLKLLVDRTSRAAGIAALLRRALLDWGVPEIVKTDNGADYTSRHVTGVLAALDVAQQLCPPFAPDRKPFVERALKTFLHDLVELLPGFVGHNVAERQAIEARKSFADRLMKGGERVDATQLSAAELQAFCDRWCAERYAHKPHGGLKGRTPFEVAAGWQGGVRRIADERALDVLLSAPADDGWRTVRKKGIQLGGHWYDDPALGGLEGQRVRVLCDEADAGHLYVFDDAGRFVCKAFSPELTGRSPREIAAERRRRQRQVVAAGKTRLRQAAKRAGVADIAGEILDHDAAQAAKVAAFPQAADRHSTPALDEAGRAARAGETPTPTPRTAREEEHHAAVVADLSAARQPHAPTPHAFIPPQDPLARTMLRLELAEARRAGHGVDPEAAQWAARFGKTEQGQREMRAFQETAEARRALAARTA